MSRRLLVILALLAVAFAVLTALAVRKGILGPQQQTVALGGPFQLVDQTGRTVDQSVLKGKWSAVFFGFTACPDVCPTTLFSLGQAQKLLGPKGEDLQTVFISVDPARDTPRQMAAYLANDAFPSRTLGLTGSPAQVDRAAKAFHVYYAKAGEGTDYSVNHSAITFLMDPRGRFACAIPYGLSGEQMAQKIETAMKRRGESQSC